MLENPLPLEAVLTRFEGEAASGHFETGRYRCHYCIWGSGLPIVLIHGLADQARSFAPLMAALAPSFRCVAYELPDGRGDGARIGRYRHADLVADLLALLDHLRIEKALLLGSSFGSTIALAALRAEPRFLAGILQGGFACRPLARFERALARVTRFWPGRMRHMPGRPRVMAKLDRPAFATAPPEVYDFFLKCSGQTPIRAAACRALLLNGLDLRPQLAAIRQPILLIGGDCDAIVPRTCEAELESRLPDVRRIEFARCGHYPQYTRPAAMAAAIRSFAAAEKFVEIP